jgi:hypothetical protein
MSFFGRKPNSNTRVVYNPLQSVSRSNRYTLKRNLGQRNLFHPSAKRFRGNNNNKRLQQYLNNQSPMNVSTNNPLRIPMNSSPPRNTTVKRGIHFSNGSKPGNNINKSLPSSNLTMTRGKVKFPRGSNVVRPTKIFNVNSKNNYNRSYSKNTQNTNNKPWWKIF